MGPPGSNCDVTCEAQGLGCSVYDQRDLKLPTAMNTVLGTALQNLTCVYPYDPTNEDYQPTVNTLTSACVAEGQSSTCSAAPPPGMRRLW